MAQQTEELTEALQTDVAGIIEVWEAAFKDVVLRLEGGHVETFQATWISRATGVNKTKVIKKAIDHYFRHGRKNNEW